MTSHDPLMTIRQLLEQQNLAVLATSLDGHPYTTLVAVAASDDLRQLYFATTRATRKFSNLSKDQRVSLLFDNRTNSDADYRHARALTALGRGYELSAADRQSVMDLYLKRLPSLRDFVSSPSCALFRVNVERYSLVQRFQDVIEVELRP